MRKNERNQSNEEGEKQARKKERHYRKDRNRIRGGRRNDTTRKDRNRIRGGRKNDTTRRIETGFVEEERWEKFNEERKATKSERKKRLERDSCLFLPRVSGKPGKADNLPSIKTSQNSDVL